MAPSVLERQLLRARNGLTYYAGLSRVPLAQTPRDLVWQRDTARLWRYRSEQRSEWELPRLAAVVDEGQAEGGLVVEMLTELAFHHHPAGLFGDGRVAL